VWGPRGVPAVLQAVVLRAGAGGGQRGLPPSRLTHVLHVDVRPLIPRPHLEKFSGVRSQGPRREGVWASSRGVWDLGLRVSEVEGSGFRVYSVECRVYSVECRV
jgi:hypothetical protein